MWGKALRLLEGSASSITYKSWIQPLKPLKVVGNDFYLQTGDEIAKPTLERRYVGLIADALRVSSGRDFNIVVTLPEAGEDAAGHTRSIYHASLQNRYSFENFVKGKSNEFAFAAALAVAQAPGDTPYNPLFLYGGVGLGKTHLMYSIGNFILNVRPDAKVLYVSAENMTNDFITSLAKNRNQEFRDKYRTLDVLLVDDIQFLSGKEETQGEFFHTFDDLRNAKKQIVISSDRPPVELKTLAERLRTRIGNGLQVDITAPDFETRVAILEKKAELERIKIPSEIIRVIARSISSNIRDLESALTLIIANAKLVGKEPTVALAEDTLREKFNAGQTRVFNIAYIQEVTAARFNLTADDLRSKNRTANITAARHVAMYLSRKILDVPLDKIGAGFGRHHSSVLYACNEVVAKLEGDETYKKTLLDLELKIRGE